MTLQTEFQFEMPRGYVDGDGNLHKKGTMRLATWPIRLIPPTITQKTRIAMIIPVASLGIWKVVSMGAATELA